MADGYERGRIGTIFCSCFVKKRRMARRQKPFSKIWFESPVPALFRPPKGQVLVRVDKHPTNRCLIKLGRNWPRWVEQRHCYQVPAAWFSKLAKVIVNEFGAVWIIQPFREKQICAPACRDAEGLVCECSCMGEFHGVNHAGNGWFEVSESFMVRYSSAQWACRLLKAS